jgi:hypothetical protein
MEEDQNTHYTPAAAQRIASPLIAGFEDINLIGEGTTTTNGQNGSTPLLYIKGWRLHTLTIGLVYIPHPKKYSSAVPFSDKVKKKLEFNFFSP